LGWGPSVQKSSPGQLTANSRPNCDFFQGSGDSIGMSEKKKEVLSALELTAEESLYSSISQICDMHTKISCRLISGMATSFQLSEQEVVKAIKKAVNHQSKGEPNPLDKQGVHVVGDQVCEKLKIKKNSSAELAVGCIVGVMIGDVLGAAVEGWPLDLIIKEFPKGIKNFTCCTHMGVRNLGFRYGRYTDDSNSTLAIANSIVDNKGICPQDCALECARWYKHEPKRGCPDTAAALFESLLKGMDYKKSGFLRFPDGSYANGGSMKASPVGVVLRNINPTKSPKVFREYVKGAVMGTHQHPEAIDGAACIAAAVGYAFGTSPELFEPLDMIARCRAVSESEGMIERLKSVEKALKEFDMKDKKESKNLCKADLLTLSKLGGIEFQIRAIQAVPQVLYLAGRFFKHPEATIVNMVMVGGDTDTTASMIGGIMGALHGTGWIPVRWWDNLENDTPYGRDAAARCAVHLSDIKVAENQTLFANPPAQKSSSSILQKLA